jgi:hypothetical protein
VEILCAAAEQTNGTKTAKASTTLSRIT